MISKLSKFAKRLAALSALVCCLALMATVAVACDNGNGDPTPQPEDEVKVTAVEITNKTELEAAWYVGEGDRAVAISLTPVTLTPDNTDVTLTSDNPNIVSVVAGTMTIHAVKAGSATITATAGEKSDSVTVTVSGLESITISNKNKLSETLFVDDEKTVEIGFTPDRFTAENTEVTLSSDKPEIVSVVAGTMKIRAVKVGSAVITATAGDKTDTVTVTVVDIEDVNITNKQALTAEWYVDDERTPEVELLPASLPEGKYGITVLSSNEDAVVYDEDSGKLRAVGAGNATITVKAGDKQDTVDVQIKAVDTIEVTDLDAIKADMNEVDAERTLTVTYSPAVANTQIKIVSDKPETVSATNEGGTIKIKAGATLGTATITVSARGKSVSFTVTRREKYGQAQMIFGDAFIENAGNYLLRLTEGDRVMLPKPSVVGAKGGTIAADDISVACQNANVTIMENTLAVNAVGAYTLAYSVTDDDTEVGDKTVTETVTLYVYRKILAEASADTQVNNNFTFDNDGAAETMINSQTVTLKNADITETALNFEAGKTYYVEAEYNLNLGSDVNTEAGFAHMAVGKPSYFAVVKRDPANRDAYTGEYTQGQPIKEYDHSKNYGYTYAHPYVLKIDQTRKTDTGNTNTLKVAVMRDGNYFYLFVDGKYVLCANRPEYADIDTVPALFGRFIKKDGGDSTVGKIKYLSGQEATAKLAELIGHGEKMLSGYGYNGNTDTTAAISDGTLTAGYDQTNGVTVDYKATDRSTGTGSVSPYMYFYGDFTFEFVYKPDTANLASDSRMYMVATPFIYDNMGENKDENKLFELGMVRNNSDWDLWISRQFTRKNYGWNDADEYITKSDGMPYDVSEGIRYTVSRKLTASCAYYVISAQSVAHSEQKAVRTFTWEKRGDDSVATEDARVDFDTPIMLVLYNQKLAGKYTQITWSDNSQASTTMRIQDNDIIADNVKHVQHTALEGNNTDLSAGAVLKYRYENVTDSSVKNGNNLKTGKYICVVKYSTSDANKKYGLHMTFGHGDVNKNQEDMFDVSLDAAAAGAKYAVFELELDRPYISDNSWQDYTLYITLKAPYSFIDADRTGVTVEELKLYQVQA